jgi:AcrR family transcriptional regulator
MPAPSDLPPAVAVAWGLAARGTRGPKPAFTLEDIVAAAVALADDQGLEAVSMTRVAAGLGYSTMSLYRYVGSKEELLLHMQDAAWGAAPRRETDGAGWREGLAAWTRATMRLYRAHPWVVDIPIGGPPLLPKSLDWMDCALSLLAETPLTGIERLATLSLLTGYARTEVSLERNLQRARAAQPQLPEADEGDLYVRQLRAVVSADRLPALWQLLEEGLFVAPPSMPVGGEDDFMVDYGLERILDGIQALIDARGKPNPPVE